MVVAVTTAVDPGPKATHPRHMNIALRALPNHAGADSSASLNHYGGEQILGIIPANLESFTLSTELNPLPANFFNIAEASIDQRNCNQHGFGFFKVSHIRTLRGTMASG